MGREDGFVLFLVGRGHRTPRTARAGEPGERARGVRKVSTRGAHGVELTLGAKQGGGIAFIALSEYVVVELDIIPGKHPGEGDATGWIPRRRVRLG